jgi:predicted nucleic acid-binding protein
LIVVSDTSPLNYLILLRQQELLPNLFGRVFIPPAVADELAHLRAPESVRNWIARPPNWVEIKGPCSTDPTIGLGAGERQAICLAAEMNADLLLADDKSARRLARQKGLAVTGTLGVLELAATRRLIELRPTIAALRRTGYQITDALVNEVLTRDAQRPR